MAVKKKESSKGIEKLHELAGKARVELEKILSIIGKEADLSSKFVKGKMDVMSLDANIEHKYIELGKEVYNLIARGEITDPRLKVIGEELNTLYRKVEEKKKELGELKSAMKNVTKKVK